MMTISNTFSPNIRIDAKQTEALQSLIDARTGNRIENLCGANSTRQEMERLARQWACAAKANIESGKEFDRLLSKRLDVCDNANRAAPFGEMEIADAHAGQQDFPRLDMDVLRDGLAVLELNCKLDRQREMEARGRLFKAMPGLNAAVRDEEAAPPSEGELSGHMTFAEANVAAAQDVQRYSNTFAQQAGLSEIWKNWASLLASHNQDLELYRSALEKYANYYQEIVNLINLVQNNVSSNGEDKYSVDFQKIKEAMTFLSSKYTTRYINQDRIIAGAALGLSEKEADAICKKLGLSANCKLQMRQYNVNDKRYCIIPDLGQLDTLLNDADVKNGKKINMDMTKFNLWKSAFDAQSNRIQEAIESLTQKTTNRFNQFDSAHKTISAMMEAMLNMMLKLLQF